MSPAELDNANPTIINASELPTRKQKVVPRKGPDCKYTDVIFARPSYLSSPFCGDDYGAAIAWPRGSGADDGVDDSAPEPIDEQEIYGKLGVRICPLQVPSHAGTGWHGAS